jgi:hypothetical protein
MGRLFRGACCPMWIDGQKVTPTLAKALLALPRFEKYVNTVQCKGCKMIQQSKTVRDRHKEGCPVDRVEKLLLVLYKQKWNQQ